MGKKCSKLYWQAFHTHTPFRAMPIWKKHISKRGFPYFVWYCEKASVAEELLISYSSCFCLPDCAFLSFCFCLPAATVLLFSLFLSLYRCVDTRHPPYLKDHQRLIKCTMGTLCSTMSLYLSCPGIRFSDIFCIPGIGSGYSDIFWGKSRS